MERRRFHRPGVPDRPNYDPCSVHTKPHTKKVRAFLAACVENWHRQARDEEMPEEAHASLERCASCKVVVCALCHPDRCPICLMYATDKPNPQMEVRMGVMAD